MVNRTDGLKIYIEYETKKVLVYDIFSDGLKYQCL